MSFLLRLIINALAIWLATYLLRPDMEVVGGDDTTATVLVFLAVALLFGVVNAIVKPLVKVVSFPIYILTLGLFTLVVNAAMLWLVSWLSGWLSEQFAEAAEYGLYINNFGTAVIGALIISVVSFVMSLIVPGARKR